MSDFITIGFSRPSKMWPIPPFFAWAIMAFESLVSLKWRNFSHAYVRFHMDGYDRDVVFQASGTKVNFIGWEKFQEIEVIVHEFQIPITHETETVIIQSAIDELGAPYALFGAFGIVAVKAAALFGRKIKNPVTQKGAWCSEVAAMILRDYDSIPFTADEVRAMTPADVCDYLSAHMPA